MSNQPDDALDEKLEDILLTLDLRVDNGQAYVYDTDEATQSIKAIQAEQVRLARLDELIAIEKLYCNDENVLIDYMRLRIAELQNPTKDTL